jgi:hypothetical protein
MVDEAKVLIAASGMKILPISDLEVTGPTYHPGFFYYFAGGNGYILFFFRHSKKSAIFCSSTVLQFLFPWVN